LGQHRRRRQGRYPALTVAVALVSGICADRACGIPFPVWLALGATGIAGWLPAVRLHRPRLAVAFLLTGCASAAAAYHHSVWHALPVKDIETALASEPVLIRLTGRIATHPEQSRRPALYRDDTDAWDIQTRFDLATQSLDVRSGTAVAHSIPVSGLLRIHVAGELAHVSLGDTVQLTGWAATIEGPSNPGQFDYRSALRRMGVRGSMQVGGPELVTVVVPASDPVTRLRITVRRRCEQVLDAGLSDRVRPVARALLLGDRWLIDRDTRAAFVDSGTIHILAISGLHIGILAAFLLAVTRGIGLSGRSAVAVTLVLLTMYLGIADARPPMIRAWILVALWSLARLLRRPAFSGNSLAVAAVLILILNPTSLFDVGVQLSFLAVACIFWWMSLDGLQDPPEDASDRPLSAKARAAIWSVPHRVAVAVMEKLRAAYGLSGTIWLATSPLVAGMFHVVSPAGLIVNVLLLPVVAASLWSGFLALLAGSVWPPAGRPFAWLCDLCLRPLLALVECAADMPLGHVNLPGPSGWWLLIFYVLVALAMAATRASRHRALIWPLLPVWLIAGLLSALRTPVPDGLRCTVLDVGHGLSVLVETPSGRTLLYDTGSRGGGSLAARTTSDALWFHRHAHIDVLVISHADVDHYNGVEPLLADISAGTAFVSRHFPDDTQPLTLKMAAALLNRGTRLEFLARGDRLDIDPDVSIQVLHPAAADTFRNDNAASLVLHIGYAGRGILLTGDLQADGLESLLAQPPRPVDLLLAPHHGDRTANSPDLARWAAPRWVVASAPARLDTGILSDRYGSGVPVYSTGVSGAIECRISPTGEMTVLPFASR